jgi:hypothetical protein
LRAWRISSKQHLLKQVRAAYTKRFRAIKPTSKTVGPPFISQSAVTRARRNRRIDAHVARTQFGQIMDRAVEHNERFVVERRCEPAVVIMRVHDFIRTAAPPPDWLEQAWRGAKRRGIDKLTSAEIDAETTAYRREKKGAHRLETK